MKRWGALGCLVMIGMLLAGCGGSKDKKSDPPNTAVTATPVPLTIIPITASNAAQVSQIKVLQEAQVEQVFSVAFSPDGTLLASGGGFADHTVRLWDTRTGKTMRVIPGHKHIVWAIAFSPDQTLMATASEDGTLRLWEAATGKQVAQLETLDRAIYGVAFSPDGKTLASVDGYKSVRLWDVAARKQIGTLEGNEQLVESVAISPDGKLLATGGGDAAVRLWNLATRESLGILGQQGGTINHVAFSPDGTWVASAALGGEVTLWDVKTKASQSVMHSGFLSSAYSVAFSPDGSVLAFGMMDGTIGLWDVTAEKGLATLQGHTDQVGGLAFSPDGTLLASASLDGTVSLWGIQGTPAPDFSVTVFDHPRLANRGELLTLAGLKGKVVVINFWGSFAVPCQQEAPLLERLWNEYKDQNVIFIGIDLYNTEKSALAYLDQYGITYPNALDHGTQIAEQYGIIGVPETFVVNTKGEIIWHVAVPVNESNLRAQIERARSG